MNLNVEHNLTDDELVKALAAMSIGAGIEEDVRGHLCKAQIDDAPKIPNEPLLVELFDRFTSMYPNILWAIVDDAKQVITKGKKRLFKAQAALAWQGEPLTPAQIREIMQRVQDRFGFIAASFQSDFVPDDATLARWKEAGIIPRTVTAKTFASYIPEADKLIRNAFIFGRLHLAINQGATTYNEALRLALDLPITKPSQYAVQIAESQAARYITSFGNDLSTAVGQMLTERNRRIVHDMVVKFHKKELQAIKLNDFAPDKIVETWQGLASELYRTMDDKARDWQRIAYFELYDAKRTGEGLALMAKYGPDQLVYKEPMTTACAQCVHLYMNGTVPRLYRLADMLGYGNNIGRKPMPTRGGKVASGDRPDGADTLKGVVGLVHPWCQCQGPFIATPLDWWYEDALAAYKGES